MKDDSSTEYISGELAEQVNRAVEVLKSGGVVAYPTDTVYGLGADITNDKAVRKIYSIKDRPLGLPLPVLIAEASDVVSLTAERTAAAELLMDRFWPGALTIIFHRNPAFNSLVLGGSDRVGIRLPASPLTRLMIGKLGRPVVGTSANLHDGKNTLTAREVKEQLGDQVDFTIDAGPCSRSIESTVVDVTVDPPAILRRGIIPPEEIMEAIKRRG